MAIPLIAGAQTFTGSWEWHGSKESGSSLKTQRSADKVRFQLEVSRGAPSYNSGFIEGEFALRGADGVFSSTEDEGCEIAFHFDAKRVKLVQATEKGNCGFGFGVYASGTLSLQSRRVPKFSKGDPRAGGN